MAENGLAELPIFSSLINFGEKMHPQLIVINSGAFPIPAVSGGAVENLTEILLRKNEKEPKFEFTVFSAYSAEAKRQSKQFKYTKFIFIKTKGLCIVFQKLIFFITNKFSTKYHGNYYIRRIVSILRTNRDCSKKWILLENAPEYAITLKGVFPNCSVIQHLHNKYLYRGSKRCCEIVNSSFAFWGVSKFVCAELVKIENLDKRRVDVFYNGADYVRFSSPVSREQILLLRAQLGLCEQDFVFVFSGRIIPAKGIDVLMRAFQIVNEKYSYTRLLVLGGAVFEGSSVPSALRKNQNVIFTGFVKHSKIANYYKLGRVAVLPSLCDEAFSLTCLEALCSGLPVVITDSGGMPEVVDESCAFVIPRGDSLPERLAERMLFFIENNVPTEGMGCHAQMRGRMFSLEKYWERFIELANTTIK